LSVLRIGIDPDLQASGIAIMEDGKLTDLTNLSFHQLMTFIECHPQAIYSVEDVEALKPTFQRKKVTQAGMLKIAQNVGQVKAVGRLIVLKLEDLGLVHELIKPLRGQVKKAKTDAKFFNQLTGWDSRSNADNRDAALLLLRYLKKD